MQAIYVRVSTDDQTTHNQERELDSYMKAQESLGISFTVYRDTFTGRVMDRPGWNALWSNVLDGTINKIVVWRLDRLGRTSRGLITLRDELISRGVTLLSLRDGIDLSTPTGRLMFNVIASVAEYETEVRSERQKAGIARARSEGKRWGGGKRGRRVRVTHEKEESLKRLLSSGMTVASVSRTVGLSRKTIYEVMRRGEGIRRVSR